MTIRLDLTIGQIDPALANGPRPPLHRTDVEQGRQIQS
jgi:hypothetical protein